MSRSEVSAAQLAANRANARKSTGPRTAEGKARSSQNAARHSLFRTVLVLENEDQQEFDELLRDVMNSYEPQSVAEQLLVEQIVQANWKIRRLQRAERKLYEEAAEGDDDFGTGYEDDEEDDEFNSAAVLLDILDSETHEPQFERLMKIEQRLQGTIARAQRELERLRKLRRQARKDEEQGLHQRESIELTPLQNEPNSDANDGQAGSCGEEPADQPVNPCEEHPAEASPATCDRAAEEAPEPNMRL